MKDKSTSLSSVNSLEGNESSIDIDDEEYIEVNEDSPNNTPNIVETRRSKIMVQRQVRVVAHPSTKTLVVSTLWWKK